MKKIISGFIAILILLSITVPVFAADSSDLSTFTPPVTSTPERSSANLPMDEIFSKLVGDFNVDGGYIVKTGKGDLTDYMPQIICAITIAASGFMYAFGQLDSVQKTAVNVILATSVSTLVGSTIFSQMFPLVSSSPPPFNYPNSTDWLSGFMYYYIWMCQRGAWLAYPTVIKLLAIMTAINISVDLIFKYSQVGIKYLVGIVIKFSFFMWLINNWVGGEYGIADHICKTFEFMGYLIAGASDTLTPGSIVANAKEVISLTWEGLSKLNYHNLTAWFSAIFIFIVTIAAIILTALQMFMARVEFWTISTISIFLIPFGMWEKTTFLFEKALAAVLNTGIKMAVISFLIGIITPILIHISDPLKNNSSWTTSNIANNLGTMVNVMIAAIVIAAIIWKIPQLIQGMLTGNPSLGGGDLFEPAKAATAMAVGGMATASAVKSSMNDKDGNLFSPAMSTLGGSLKNLAASAATGNYAGAGAAAISATKSAASIGLNSAKLASKTGYQLGRNKVMGNYYSQRQAAITHQKNASGEYDNPYKDKSDNSETNKDKSDNVNANNDKE